MTETYQPGDRVRLVRTTDLHTRLKPGTAGTVTHTDSTGTVHVRWDDGSTLGMVLDEGDQISRIVDTGGAS